MQVIAIAPGYDNVKVREVDEVFDMPDGAVAEWFVPLGFVELYEIAEQSAGIGGKWLLRSGTVPVRPSEPTPAVRPIDDSGP